MIIKFGKLPLHNELIITAESREEAEQLGRWDNCVLSAKFDYDYNEKPPRSKLQIVKEL